MKIPAAGTVPWRVVGGVLQVLLVHRPRYDDWSWAKGKLDPGELWPVAASRETEEEASITVALGLPLPESRYTVLGRGGLPDEKVVRYWAGSVTGGGGRLFNEIDEIAWLDAQAAFDRLSYARDRDQLLAVVRAHQRELLDTRAVVLVRHAKAVARSDYSGTKDWLRPLDKVGFARSKELVPLLSSYGVTRLVSSPSTRCVQTLRPYAARLGAEVVERPRLSEEGYDARPEKAAKILLKELRSGAGVAICSHGPLMRDLVDVLVDSLAMDTPDSVEAVELLAEAKDERLVKGEALVCHVAGQGPDAKVVAVERHTPSHPS